MVDVVVPEMGADVEEAMLVTWFVEVGDEVSEGDMIAELQVEKVSTDLVAPAAGRVDELLLAPGEVASIGAPIARITSGGSASSEPSQSSPATSASPTAPPPAVRPATSPAARRLARELGVDLASVTGTGPNGRIVEDDVRRAAQGDGGGQRDAAPAAAEPLSPVRRQIAERMRRSLAETAQLTLTAEADLTDLVAALTTDGVDGRRRITAAIVAACAATLPDHPRLAMRRSGDGLAPATSTDIGVAVSVEEGLLVPVIRQADTKSVTEIAEEIQALAARARSGELGPQETTGAVFSITTLGAHRIDAFTPILNPPQSAILGVGAVRRRPAVVAEEVVPRDLCVLSLTIDHAVIDGAPAATFLAALMERLEEPDALLG